MRSNLQALFCFPTQFGEIQNTYGGNKINNENKQTKPYCPLIGQDGNIFNLVEIASRTLKRNGLSEEAPEITSKVFKSRSYDKALGIIGEYVHIAAVNEPVCYRIDRKRD